LWRAFGDMKERLTTKKIEGNYAGEGLLQGGVMVVSPTKGVVYLHNEVTGSELPYVEIANAAKTLV